MNLGSTVALISTLVIFGLCKADTIRYDGHKVLQIFPKEAQNVQKIINEETNFNLDFWQFPKHLNDSFHIRMNPVKLEPFLSFLRQIGTDAEVLIHDVQKMIDRESRHVLHTRAAKLLFSNPRNVNFDTFHTYNEIKDFLNTTSLNAPAGIKTTVESIGTTVEGRDILVIRIEESNPSFNVKPHIFIDGGIHAREWISPASTMYFIDQLVNHAYLPHNANLLHKFVWHIVPVLNPDGYDYSHKTERLWRKNRRLAASQGRPCYGVDLNRNFDHQWNPAIGGSTNPCSDIYASTSSLSEAESQSLSNYLARFKNVVNPLQSNMIAYLTIHSYGQMWLYPWGYTSVLPTDWVDLDSAAKAAVSQLTGTYGTQYLIGSSTNVLYSAAGGSDDSAKGTHHIKYSYTLELRDQGTYGFQLPHSQIRATCEETWNGIVGFADDLIGKHCSNSNGECIWQ